ncbi:MAG TPA: hypothetical protein V6D22_17305, partial [Candidatus Obscuribacterales bacterium]
VILNGQTGGINANTGTDNLQANASLTVTITNTSDSNGLSLGASTGGTGFTITDSHGITTTGDITSTNGVVIINAPSLTITLGTTVSGTGVAVNGVAASDLIVVNAGTITATTGSITIDSAAGFNLDISGGGTMNATSGSVTLSATMSGGTANELHFLGDQTFNGTTILNAGGVNQVLIIDPLANVVGNNALTANISEMTLDGTISGNPLTINASFSAGTIASNGTLNLKSLGNLTFVGQSLTILSAGNIINTGGALTINLSNPNGNGGSLSLIAGFDFTPAASATLAPNGGLYTLQSATSGSIQLPNVSIVTSAAGANNRAGNVVAVANGSISLGSITATADATSGIGGSVTIIGTGIEVGAINTTAATSGAVTITSAKPTPSVPNMMIADGILTGSFSAGLQPLGGNVLVHSINAGAADVSISTGGKGRLQEAPRSTITAGLLSLTSDLSNFRFAVNASSLDVNTNGSATIIDNVLVSLGNSAVGGVLNLTDNNGIDVDGTVSGSRRVNLRSGTGITLDNAQLSSNSAITLTALNGAVTTQNGTDISSGAHTLFINARNGSVDIGTGTQVSAGAAGAGTLKISASTTVTLDGVLTAGSGSVANPILPVSPATLANNVPLNPNQIASRGSIIVRSGAAGANAGITIANGSGSSSPTINSFGGNITLTAPVASTGGAATVDMSGGTNNLEADGGSIVIVTPGSILGGTSNNGFVARAVGQNNRGVGGLVVLDAGVTRSNQGILLHQAANFIAPATSLSSNNPSAILVQNNSGLPATKGVVVVNPVGTTGVNLSTAGATTTFTLNGGGVLFNSANGGTVQMNGATFTVNAFKPIADVKDQLEEIVVDSSDDADELAEQHYLVTR